MISGGGFSETLQYGVFSSTGQIRWIIILACSSQNLISQERDVA